MTCLVTFSHNKACFDDLQAEKAEAEKQAEALGEELERAKRDAANAVEEAEAARIAALTKAAAEQVRARSTDSIRRKAFFSHLVTRRLSY